MGEIAGEGGFCPTFEPTPPGFNSDTGEFISYQGPGNFTDIGGFTPRQVGYRTEHGDFEPYEPMYRDEHGGVHPISPGPYNSPIHGEGYIDSDNVFHPNHNAGEDSSPSLYGPAPDFTPQYHVPDSSNQLISQLQVKKSMPIPSMPVPSNRIIYKNTETVSHQRPLPENAIKQSLVIGGKSPWELEKMLEQARIALNFSNNDARDLLHNKDFTTLPSPKSIITVRLRVRDLGLPEHPSPDMVYLKAKECGLDLCPAEVGPWMRMSYKNQPNLDHLRIAMKEIYVRPYSSLVFSLDRFMGPLCLGGHYMNSGSTWDLRDELVFLLHQR